MNRVIMINGKRYETKYSIYDCDGCLFHKPSNNFEKGKINEWKCSINIDNTICVGMDHIISKEL